MLIEERQTNSPPRTAERTNNPRDRVQAVRGDKCTWPHDAEASPRAETSAHRPRGTEGEKRTQVAAMQKDPHKHT